MRKMLEGWYAIPVVLFGLNAIQSAVAATSSQTGGYECRVFEVHGAVLATDRHAVRAGDQFRIDAKGETESALWEDLIGNKVPVISSGALSSEQKRARGRGPAVAPMEDSQAGVAGEILRKSPERFFVWFETAEGKVLSECDSD